MRLAGSISIRGILRGRCKSRGQGTVEALVILPILVLFMIAIVQFTLLYQAKLMTEYAAFQAARAGIVWNGNNQKMHDAALFAVLPSFGPTDGTAALVATRARAEITDRFLNGLPWGGPVPTHIHGSTLKGLIRVDTVNPAHFSELDNNWKVEGGSNWNELDFDGVETYPEHPLLTRYFPNFYSPGAVSSEDAVLRKASVLSVRVRYLYELKVPLANWIIFVAWYAANAGLRLTGPLERPNVPQGLGQPSAIANTRGFDTLYPSEFSLLWRIASGRLPNLMGRRYFFPLTAEYTMRMQSNFHRKWILHDRPSWEM